MPKILGVALGVSLLAAAGRPALAEEPHEDPGTAVQAFSAVSLLRYYAGSLDFVLSRDPDVVRTRLEKMPYANIPDGLEESSDGFVTASISISSMVVEVDDAVNRFNDLLRQSRFAEATDLADQTLVRLSQANGELDRVLEAAITTGDRLNIPAAGEDSALKTAYDDLLDRIERIRQLLDLYKRLLSLPPDAIDQELRVTAVTLEVEPVVAFVGDEIRVEGFLTSDAKPLDGRAVDIMVDSGVSATVTTDASGRYQGALQVPYRYVREMDVQALYYPRGKDVGVYLASLSPVVALTVLFYDTDLKVTTEEKAYPGLETVVTGRFDYGQSPSLDRREVEIYLDDELLYQGAEGNPFAEKIKIDERMALGQHRLTVVAAPEGRYAPTVTEAVLDVTRAAPALAIDLPGLALIPGSIDLRGTLYSELGPVDNTTLKMMLGNSRFELASAEDGSFDGKARVGIGLGLIGRQDLLVQVYPRQPWLDTLTTTRSLLMVNWVNTGGILIGVIFAGAYLPRTLRSRLGLYRRKKGSPVVEVTPLAGVPAYSQPAATSSFAAQDSEIPAEPRGRILYWYRLAARLLATMTKTLLVPQQTLREFAMDSGKTLGAAAKPFVELTGMVEKLLYSRYTPTEADAERSKQLSSGAAEGLKNEGI